MAYMPHGHSRASSPTYHLCGPHLSVIAPPGASSTSGAPRPPEKQGARNASAGKKVGKGSGPGGLCSFWATLRPRVWACRSDDKGAQAHLRRPGRDSPSVCNQPTPHFPEEETEFRPPAQGCPVTVGWDQETGARLPLLGSLPTPSLNTYKGRKNQQCNL